MSGNVSNSFFLKTYLNLLSRLRESGSIFAKQNPEIAPYLDMSNRKSADPEIERLIESFAFMASQVEYKSLLAQNEYLIQFIENILPEITQPIPGLGIIKCEINEKIFPNQKSAAVINAQSLFSVMHTDESIFYFSTAADYELNPFFIENVSFVNASSSKENLYNNRKAFVFNLKSLFSINKNKNEKTKIRLYINSDLNNVMNIIDCLLNSHRQIIVVNDADEKFTISRSHLKIPFEFDSYTQQNNNSNCLYPLFDFCKFYNKYYFLDIILPEFISCSESLKIIIPVENEFPYKFDLKEDTFLNNCIPVFNYFKKNIKPIRTTDGIYEYEVHAEFLKNLSNDIISIDDVSTFHATTGEILEIVNYHKRTLSDIHNKKVYQNCYWVSRRNFYTETEQHGTLLLRLVLTDESIHLPEYLNIDAFCTNGKDVSKILPGSPFTVENGNIRIKSETFGWIQSQENITDIVEKIDTISHLFLVNQKLLSNNFDNVEDILMSIEILSSTNNPIYVILQRVLNSVKSVDKKQYNEVRMLNGQAYHVPGYIFTFNFLSASQIPTGFFFILEFLNAFFSYVRGLNFFIKFDYVFEEVVGNKR